MRIQYALVVASMLAGCGSGAPDAASPPAGGDATPRRTVSSELPAGARASSDVLEMRRLAGVWRSSPGALPGAAGRTLQLEIAFDRSFDMTLWGKDPKGSGEAVFARQSGRIGNVAGGFAGSASSPARSALSSFSTWSATAPRDGAIVVSSGGHRVLLRRSGN